MRRYFSVFAALVAVLLVCGCMGTPASPSAEGGVATTPATTATPTAQVQDHTFVQTIIYTDDDTTTVISKNKLAKAATIEVTMHFHQPDEGINKTAYYQFGTALTAGALQMAFFNETALAEFNAQVEAWNSQECTVQDDSPADQKETTPGENPLAGYTVQSLTIHILEEGTEAPISEVSITGPAEGDISITYL